nr:CBM_HP1_G0024580.mRNA.1.CDS.1 [Saccharomyces cerevisiae]
MSSNNDLLLHLVSQLNTQQRAAALFDYTRGLQVIAGPGTGKTKVLTSRVAYLILHHHIHPRDIIVTTFTNKAANEMKERLQEMLRGAGVNISELLIGTFHSICLKILYRFGHLVDLQKDWRIIDEKEIDVILDDMIEKVPDQIRDYASSITRKVNLCMPSKNGDEWTIHPKLIKKQISKLKSNAILPEEYILDSNHDAALGYFYQIYQSELSKKNTLDFDDLLMYTFRLLTRVRVLSNIKHVLVDEFQDTNGIQLDLMFLFAKGNHHLSRGMTIVGDPDQSIYAFRNALAHNFLEMGRKCPIEYSTIILVENYRSSQKILNTSEILITQQNKGRQNRAPLRAQFDLDFPPVYMNFPAYFLEAPSLVRELLYLKALPNLFTFNDFAILVRQRRQIKRIESALIEHRIPYKIIRGHSFWDSKETRAMLNLLKLIFSPNDKHAILASLLYPARGLGPATGEKIKNALDTLATDVSCFQILKDISSKKIMLDIPTKGRSVIADFISMIENCQLLLQSTLLGGLSDLFDKLYELSGLKYEYLYKDGKKKNDQLEKSEPNLLNARHKNIELLKNYFLALLSKSESSDKEKNEAIKAATDEAEPIENKVITPKEYLRNFFNSLSLHSDAAEEEESESNKDAKIKREKNGFVTISTIHGAKGLEWPVVFIPGCEEGIIPCVFNDDKKDESEEDEEEDQENSKKDASPKKTRVLSVEDSIDEERRMFFVAQTRAKYLLYLSNTVTVEDVDRPRIASRFLTTDLIKAMSDSQKLFESTNSIKKLYRILNKKPPAEDDKLFSLDQLRKDYNQFIENRRERMIWQGIQMNDVYGIQLSRNKLLGSVSDFTSAADQLRLETQNSIFPQKKLIEKSRPSKINGNYAPKSRVKSPEKRYAPETTSFHSPTKKKVYAPQYVSTTNVPSRQEFHSSTGKNIPFLRREDRSITDISPRSSTRSLKGASPNKTSHMSDDLMRPSPTRKDKVTRNIHFATAGTFRIETQSNVDELHPPEYSNKSGQSLTSSEFSGFSSACSNSDQPTNLIEDINNELDLSDEELLNDISIERRRELLGSKKTKKIKPKTRNRKSKRGDKVKVEEVIDLKSEFEEDDSRNTTAAELLHNPDDTTVDNRPIISNAKFLADAAMKKTQKFSKKVKNEPASSQMDIFSQLSRAKKKSKLNNGEIIVID